MAGSWRLASSLSVLRDQINAAYPGRNKASDGTIGDERHAAGQSEHNPNAAGVVTAIDITHDPGNGLDGQALADALILDPRAWYVIFNGRIRLTGAEWQPYYGSNPHRTHVHLSVKQNAENYDNASNWNIGGSMGDAAYWKKRHDEAAAIADERLEQMKAKDAVIADLQKRHDDAVRVAEDRLADIGRYQARITDLEKQLAESAKLADVLERLTAIDGRVVEAVERLASNG